MTTTIMITIMTIITVTRTHIKEKARMQAGLFHGGKPDQPARFAYSAVLR